MNVFPTLVYLNCIKGSPRSGLFSNEVSLSFYNNDDQIVEVCVDRNLTKDHQLEVALEDVDLNGVASVILPQDPLNNQRTYQRVPIAQLDNIPAKFIKNSS